MAADDDKSVRGGAGAAVVVGYREIDGIRSGRRGREVEVRRAATGDNSRAREHLPRERVRVERAGIGEGSRVSE